MTDGVNVINERKIFNLIENDDSIFSLCAFGIGEKCNEQFIKSSSIIGRGNYSFLKPKTDLYNIIGNFVNDLFFSCVKNFKINSSCDEFILYRTDKINTLRQNQLCDFGCVVKNEEKKIKNEKINLKIMYEQSFDNYIKNYQVWTIVYPPGEGLSKLMMCDCLTNDPDEISEEEKIKLALRYQIFIEGISLFTEIELSEKITEKLKTNTICDSLNENQIKRLDECNEEIKNGFKNENINAINGCLMKR